MRRSLTATFQSGWPCAARFAPPSTPPTVPPSRTGTALILHTQPPRPNSTACARYLLPSKVPYSDLPPQSPPPPPLPLQPALSAPRLSLEVDADAHYPAFCKKLKCQVLVYDCKSRHPARQLKVHRFPSVSPQAPLIIRPKSPHAPNQQHGEDSLHDTEEALHSEYIFAVHWGAHEAQPPRDKHEAPPTAQEHHRGRQAGVLRRLRRGDERSRHARTEDLQRCT